MTASEKESSSKASVPLKGYMILASNILSGSVTSACACHAIAHTLYRGSPLSMTKPPSCGNMGQVTMIASRVYTANTPTCNHSFEFRKDEGVRSFSRTASAAVPASTFFGVGTTFCCSSGLSSVRILSFNEQSFGSVLVGEWGHVRLPLALA